MPVMRVLEHCFEGWRGLCAKTVKDKVQDVILKDKLQLALLSLYDVAFKW